MNEDFQAVIDKGFQDLKDQLLKQVTADIEEKLGRKLDASEIKGVREDVDKLKKAMGRSGGTGGSGVELPTIGGLLRQAPDFEARLKSGASVKIKIALDGGDHQENYNRVIQRSLYNTSTDFPGLAPEVNRASVVPIKRARPRLRDFIPVIPTSTGDVYFQRESQLFELYTEVASEAAAAQKNITVDNAQGFFIGQTITIGAGVNAESHVLAGVNLTTNVLTTTNNLANTHAVDVRVVSELKAFTSEGEVKPQGKIVTEDVQVTIKTLATGISPSKQILDDAPRLQAHINVRLPDALDRSEDNQILNGDGSTNQLTGILNTSGVSARLWSNGTAGDNHSATLRRAIADVRNLHYYVDLIAVHPDIMAELDLERDDNGNYLKMLVSMPDGSSALWRVEVVEMDHLASTQALVGAFRDGAEIYDRMTLEVEIFPSHSDYAARNLVYIRAERRMGLAVLAPSAFCKVTFDSAP